METTLRLRIQHRTTYAYQTPLERGVQLAHLWPAPHAGISVLRWDVRASGARVGRTFIDGYGNRSALIDLNPAATHVEIVVEGEAETRDTASRILAPEEPLPPEFFLRTTERTLADGAIAALAACLPGEERAEALMNAVRDRLEFRIGATDVTHTAIEALAIGEGVCQDHAHLYCAAARAAGMPARYVSGYLFTGEARSEATHAWVEAFDGEHWIGFDPANRVRVSDWYVRLAVGLDYRDAAPIVGARTGGGAENLKVDVAVAAQQ